MTFYILFYFKLLLKLFFLYFNNLSIQIFEKLPFIRVSWWRKEIDQHNIIVFKTFDIFKSQNDTLCQSVRKFLFFFLISDQNNLFRSQLEYFSIRSMLLVFIQVISIDSLDFCNLICQDIEKLYFI